MEQRVTQARGGAQVVTLRGSIDSLRCVRTIETMAWGLEKHNPFLPERVGHLAAEYGGTGRGEYEISPAIQITAWTPGFGPALQNPSAKLVAHWLEPADCGML
jgi:hypothetical protein